MSGPFQIQWDHFFSQLQERDSKTFGTCDLELVALASKAAYRKGLGTALVTQFLSRARADGADTVRLFCLFAAPPERDFDWSDSGIEGASRFLARVWRLFTEEEARLLPLKACGSSAEDADSGESRDLRRREHLTVKKAGEDMGGRFQFNTAIAAVMELVNAIVPSRENWDRARQSAASSPRPWPRC